ncbi:hypothetical protein JEM67_20970 [Serratia sp. PAMC26656]|uniref:hypothetical protein n=1 Tax=Serratia sp. PAMC26656 TaxID=2775909 RepID=UPI0018F6CC7A|nr:hypothetical protein [Serratia sp. PAMC26656]MBJ7892217.1 hypothetical protein [Serratia sp. PAMC26656]
MKERPVIFNGEMVRALLDGRKTQTRRVMKDQPEVIPQKDECGVPGYWIPFNAGKTMVRNEMMKIACPFGGVGDQLWVRETFAILGNEDGCPIDWDGNLIKGDEKHAARIYKASCWQEPGNYGLWSIPDRDIQYEGTWRPSIHMPRWASRITLEITAVRVERLNSISEEDAKAEGYPVEREVDGGAHDPWLWFRDLWDGIYPDNDFKVNPWVWVIEFKQVEAK